MNYCWSGKKHVAYVHTLEKERAKKLDLSITLPHSPPKIYMFVSVPALLSTRKIVTVWTLDSWKHYPHSDSVNSLQLERLFISRSSLLFSWHNLTWKSRGCFSMRISLVCRANSLSSVSLPRIQLRQTESLQSFPETIPEENCPILSRISALKL